MACLATALFVVILSGFVDMSAAKKDNCEMNAAVGQSLTLPFAYVGLMKSNVLRWTHNNTIIFYREQGKVSFGKPEDILASGSLLLKNLQLSGAGTYQANVLHSNSTHAATWSTRLCVMDKVPKPKLTFVCDFKASAVKLNCDAAKPQDFMFSWTLDGKTLTGETGQTMSISLAQLKGEKSLTCAVANKVSQERSDAVRLTCKTPTPTPPPLLCFPSKMIVAVAAGVSGLILLLLCVIVVLCCRRARSKGQMRLSDKGEFGMLSMNDPDSVGREYETMHQAKDPSPQTPSPQTSPGACYENVSQPQAKDEDNKPGELSAPAAEEQQKPSPVPKPRTKNPQTPNM